MTICLLAAAIFGGAFHLETPAIDYFKSSNWSDAGNVSKRIAGRMLGSLIREGMTEKQVKQILGERPYFSYGIFAGGSIGTLDYGSLCVTVSLSHSFHQDGGMRVDKVTFIRSSIDRIWAICTPSTDARPRIFRK